MGKVKVIQGLNLLMLSGDFNARTSCKQDSIMCDTFVAEIDADDYVIDNPLPRYSMDKGNNSHGNKLLVTHRCHSILNVIPVVQLRNPIFVNT